jgi:hypothetical protein
MVLAVSKDPSPAEAGFVKVRMSSPDGDIETLWAVRVAEGRFRLDNSPWFAYGVSLGDIVEGTEYAPNMYELSKVVERSGNRTIRVILAPDSRADSPNGNVFIAEVKALGCDVENMNDVLLSIIIPPEVDLSSVVDYLVTSGHEWEYANPTYDQLFG